MSSAVPMPVDILFAQKASSCVKAAGMDPRQMDLRRFYELAAVIFTRAYLGIYKEPVFGMIAEPQNDDDLVNNAQKVVDGLLSKTNDLDLMEVSGTDIVSGDHRAVDIVVSTLYAEGNRLWLKKLSKLEENRQRANDQSTVSNTITTDTTQRKKHALKNGNKRGKREVREAEGIRGYDRESSGNFSELEKGTEVGYTALGLDSNSDRLEYAQREDYQSVAVASAGGVRRKRPSSAPSRSKAGPRGRIALAQAAAVERLFSAGRHKEALAQHLAQHAQQSSTQPESSSATQEKKEDKPHTYDMKSGRKILLSQEYLDALARQRKVEAVGTLKNVSDIEGGARESSSKKYNNNNESSLPPVPSRPEWPGKSTGASVDRWIKRMLVARSGDVVDSAHSHPRYYGGYQLMEKLDMVISIEHCFNCAHHNLSLRHDPCEYSRNTDTVLRAVAQLAHECGVCTRVGVTRMRARITTKSKQTDVDSRIGAFEVQIAFKDSQGQVSTELLHSKLVSRHWPNKMQMEKKLRAFILKSGVAVHPLYDPNSCSDGFGSDSLGSYPLGFVEWEETPLAETSWIFPMSDRTAEPVVAVVVKSPLDLLKKIEAGSSGIEVLVPTPPPIMKIFNSNMVELNCNIGNIDDIESKSLNVQWVFDAREVPGIVHTPIVYPSIPPTSIPVPAPPKRRPQSASAVRPIVDTKAAVLERLNSKRADSITSEKDESHTETASEVKQRKQSIPVVKSPTSRKSSFKGLSIPEQLKAISLKNAVKGKKNEPLSAYSYSSLAKKGVIAAETISSCILLRQSIIKLCASKMVNGTFSAEKIEEGIKIIFQGLDRRKKGSLGVTDIESVLTLMQNRKCSDVAMRLVVLSLDTNGDGEVSAADFLAFINRHEKALNTSAFIDKTRESQIEEDEDEEDDKEELGVLCMQIRMYLHSTEKDLEDLQLEKFITDIYSCVGKNVPGKNAESLGDGVCTQSLFLGILSSSGVKSNLSAGGMTLLLDAFSVKGSLNINAYHFNQWLEAGASDVTPDATSEGEKVGEKNENGIVSTLEKGTNEKAQPAVPGVQSIQSSSNSSSPRPSPIITTMPSAVPILSNDLNSSLKDTNELLLSARRKTEALLSARTTVSTNSDKNEDKKEDKKEIIEEIHDEEEELECFDDLVFGDRELVFTSCIVEGLALTHKAFQHLQICVLIEGTTYFASVSPAKERGTTRRTFKVDWKAITVRARAFRDRNVASITMTANGVGSDDQLEITNTVLLVKFMVGLNATFTVTLMVKLPTPGDNQESYIDTKNKTPSEIKQSQDIKIILTGTAREGAETVLRRISEMNSAELIRVTFDPLPSDEDFSSPISSAKSSPLNGTPTQRKSFSLSKYGEEIAALGIIDEHPTEDKDVTAITSPASEVLSDLPLSICTEAEVPVYQSKDQSKEHYKEHFKDHSKDISDNGTDINVKSSAIPSGITSGASSGVTTIPGTTPGHAVTFDEYMSALSPQDDDDVTKNTQNENGKSTQNIHRNIHNGKNTHNMKNGTNSEDGENVENEKNLKDGENGKNRKDSERNYEDDFSPETVSETPDTQNITQNIHKVNINANINGNIIEGQKEVKSDAKNGSEQVKSEIDSRKSSAKNSQKEITRKDSNKQEKVSPRTDRIPPPDFDAPYPDKIDISKSDKKGVSYPDKIDTSYPDKNEEDDQYPDKLLEIKNCISPLPSVDHYSEDSYDVDFEEFLGDEDV